PIHLHCHFHGWMRYIHSIVVRTFPISRRYHYFCRPSEMVRQTLLRHRNGLSVPAPECGAMSHFRQSVLHLLNRRRIVHGVLRSEKHTSELQSRENIVCRLLLEKKNPPPLSVQHE